VTDGQVKLWDRMGQDFAASYMGGSRKLELAKGHPDVVGRVHRLFDELAAEHELMLPLLERPPFATIQIGKFRKVKELKRALTDGGNRISDYASDLMDRMPLVAEPETWDLHRATNAELGLTKGGTIAQSFEAIAKVGGIKLPPEVGPYLRLNNPDQPMGEWELVYMDPIAGRLGCPGVFHVEHVKDGLWLGGCNAYPERFYGAEFVWVFGRERPVPCA